jgi:hypothetical protein
MSFSRRKWARFSEQGRSVVGFKKANPAELDSISSGDLLVCYLTGINRFVGLLRVISIGSATRAPASPVRNFSNWLDVEPIIVLRPESAVQMKKVREQISRSGETQTPSWLGPPKLLSPKVGEAIRQALEQAANFQNERSVGSGEPRYERSPPEAPRRESKHRVRADYKVRVNTPMTPLSEEEGTKLLKRLFRGIYWDDVIAELQKQDPES